MNQIKWFRTGSGKYMVQISYSKIFNKANDAREHAVKLKKAIEKTDKIKLKEGAILFD